MTESKEINALRAAYGRSIGEYAYALSAMFAVPDLPIRPSKQESRQLVERCLNTRNRCDVFKQFAKDCGVVL